MECSHVNMLGRKSFNRILAISSIFMKHKIYIWQTPSQEQEITLTPKKRKHREWYSENFFDRETKDTSKGTHPMYKGGKPEAEPYREKNHNSFLRKKTDIKKEKTIITPYIIRAACLEAVHRSQPIYSWIFITIYRAIFL